MNVINVVLTGPFEFQVQAEKPSGGDRVESPGENSMKSPAPAAKSETGWPVLKDGDKMLPTEFKDGSLKCPYCHHWIVRIKQHLMTHLDKIQNWEDAENFSIEVSCI